MGSEVTIDTRERGVATEFHLRVSLDCKANQHESRFAPFDSYAVRERVSATEHDVQFSAVTDHALKCVHPLGRQSAKDVRPQARDNLNRERVIGSG